MSERAMSKSSIGFKIVFRFFAVSLILFGVFVTACTKTDDKEPQKPMDAAPGLTLTDSSTNELLQETQRPEGSGGEVKDHPDVEETEKLERQVYIPKDVEGKWKAVKILVRNKADEGKNELKTAEIGSSFVVADSGIKVTVGPFLPNFVMDQGTYTSMNNQVINPAVQLTVEENGKILYKGWTFARYPTMYAFEHDVYALELKDHIPVDIS
ncbi:MAG: DUF2155 domain-containing protein [Nitrospinae bacterium]|jgi:hypothetical protein|nr:DUF2155 domain-containing protein [Nitrospinota bacterium]